MKDFNICNILNEHIDHLVASNNIECIFVNYLEMCYAEMNVIGEKIICIVPVKCELSYYTALHEIGHLEAKGGFYNSTVESEVIAWKWAINNSIIPLSAVIASDIKNCILDYASYNDVLNQEMFDEILTLLSDCKRYSKGFRNYQIPKPCEFNNFL